MSGQFFKDEDGNLISTNNITRVNNEGDKSRVFIDMGEGVTTSVEIDKTVDEFSDFLKSGDPVLD